MSQVRTAIRNAIGSVIETLESRRLLTGSPAIAFEPAGTRPYVEFSTGNPNQWLSDTFYFGAAHVTNLTQDAADVGITPISTDNEASFFRWGFTSPLTTGWYEAYVRDGSLASDEYEQTFSFLSADFDGSHTVDFTDFSTLQTNFGLTPATFAQGDANYDHTVNFNDYLILQNSFGQTLPALSSEPGSVSVANTTPGTLTVGWTANTDLRDGFKVYRSDDWGNTYKLVKTVPDAEARTWTDDGVDAEPGTPPLVVGQTYWYRVRAYTNAAGASASIHKASGVVPQPTPTAVATPDTVTGTTTQLGVLGDTADPTLKYTWTRLSGPAAVTFGGTQNTNAAKNTLATFTKAGTYTFNVAVRDAFYNTVVSNAVTVEVVPTAATVQVTPNGRKISLNGSLVFTASVTDQFGRSMTNAPITWDVASGPGSMSGATFTASSTPGTATVQATCGTASATATLTVEDTPFSIQPIQALSTTAGQSVNLSATFLDPRAGVSHTASIDWGDGHVDSSTYGNGTTVTEGAGSGTVSGSHTFTRKGNYTGTLRMTDSRGQTSAMPFSVTVAYTAPSLSLTGSLLPTNSGFTELTVQIKVAGADPASITSYKVDWGDGTQNQFSNFILAPFDGGTYVTLSHLAPHPSDDQPWTVKAWVSDSEPEPHYAGTTTIGFVPMDFEPEVVDNIHVASSPSYYPPRSTFNTPLDDDYEWAALYAGGRFETNAFSPAVYYNVSLNSQLQLADGNYLGVNEEDENAIFASLPDMEAFAKRDGVTRLFRQQDVDDYSNEHEGINPLIGAHVAYWRGPYGDGGPGVDLNLVRYKFHDGIHIEAVNGEAWEPSSGHSNDNTLSFKVTQGTARPYDETYAIYTPDGTATNNADYSGLPQTVTIPAGETTATFQLNVLKDHQVEGDQTVSIRVEGYRLNGYEPYNSHYEATAVIHDSTTLVSIVAKPTGTGVAEVQEGTPQDSNVENNPGFWISRGDKTIGDLTVALNVTGDATIGADYQALPDHLTIPDGETGVFLPIYLTEDITPEFTESVGVTITPDGDHAVSSGESRRAAIDIVDDDYFTIGYAKTSDGRLPATVTEGDGAGQEEQTFTDWISDANLVFGAVDGDWLNWAKQDKSEYIANGGSPDNPTFGDTLTELLQNSYDSSPLLDENGDPIELADGNSSGAASVETTLPPGMGIAILQANNPGWDFEYSAQGQYYHGTQTANGTVTRSAIYNLQLAQTHYWGAGKMMYLRYNEDGSVDRVKYRYSHPDPTIERIKQSDKLRQEMNGVFATYLAQVQQDQERAAGIRALGDAVSDLMETVLRSLPGAIVLDAQEALTGSSASRPGIQLTSGEQTISAANAAMPGALLAAGKMANLLKSAKDGMKFEKDALAILSDLDKQDLQHAKKLLTAIIDTGKVIRRIPDAVIANNVLIEVKRVKSLDRYMKQFRDHIILSEAHNIPRYRIIVDPILQSTNFEEMFRPILGAQGSIVVVTVEELDAITGKLKTLWKSIP